MAVICLCFHLAKSVANFGMTILQPKSVLKSRKPDFDWSFDDEDESPSLELLAEFCQRNNYELAVNSNVSSLSSATFLLDTCCTNFSGELSACTKF